MIMDNRKGIINVSVSIAFRVALLIGNILVRRYLIKYIGNEVNGLDSLYTSIIGFLSVAELGIGTAITFCMYKPIVDGDNDKVSALYCLFEKVYLIIGAIILAGGCIMLPILPFLAKDYQSANVNLYLTFFLMLLSVVLTYGFSAKTSLINAYKNNYITTSINSGGLIIQIVLQIIVIIFTGSFVWYLVCRIVAVVLQWAVTELITRKKYGNIVTNKQKIDADTKKDVNKNVKAMFMHKIGTVLVNTVDSIIISAFIGVVLLGKYSNYTTIMAAMVGTITLFFSPLTSIIGHLYVEEDKGAVRKYYNFFYTFNFILGCIFFLGYYAVIDNLVTICFGGGLELSKSISFVITLNYFIQFMRQSTLLFRDATGTFYYDRWKPLIEGLLNLGLSIGCVMLFNYLWGEDIAVVGVIVATIITNMFVCHIVEPYVLYKYAFNASVKKHYWKNYIYIAIFSLLLVALHFSLIAIDGVWIEMLANAGISLAFSVTASLIIMLFNKDFKHYTKKIFSKLTRKGNSNRTKNDADGNDDLSDNQTFGNSTDNCDVSVDISAWQEENKNGQTEVSAAPDIGETDGDRAQQ